MPYQRVPDLHRRPILLIFDVSLDWMQSDEAYDGSFGMGSSGPRPKSFAHPEFSQFVKLH